MNETPERLEILRRQWLDGWRQIKPDNRNSPIAEAKSRLANCQQAIRKGEKRGGEIPFLETLVAESQKAVDAYAARWRSEWGAFATHGNTEPELDRLRRQNGELRAEVKSLRRELEVYQFRTSKVN